MHASQRTAELVYFTTRHDPGAVQEQLRVDDWTVSVVSDLDGVYDRIAESPVDCVLVCESVLDDLDAIRSIASDAAAPPVIVVAGDADGEQITELLDAGAAEVIRSRLSATPTALLRRRIEGAVAHATTAHAGESTISRHEEILSGAADAIYQLGPAGEIVEVNAATTDLTGYSRSELIGANVSTVLTHESFGESLGVLRSRFVDGESEVARLSVAIRRKDGSTTDCEARLKPTREDGEITGWIGVARDVSEQLEREAKLQRTQQLLSETERLGKVGSWEYDPETEELFWSDGTRRIRGVEGELDPTVDEAIDFYHPADRDRIRELVEHCTETGEQVATEARLLTVDGEQRWIQFEAEGIETDDGRKVRGYIQDITDQKEREQQLQAERDLLEQLFELSPVGILTVAPNGTILRANEQAGAILGLSTTALEGQHYALAEINTYTPDGDPIVPEECPVRAVVDDDDQLEDERLVVELPDGERRTLTIDGIGVHEDGELRRAIVTVDDVTEAVEHQRRLTEQRNELARLDHINRIIRGVDQALVGATSREEIMEAVCEQLSESNRYRFAIALTAVGGEFEPEALAGPDAAEFVEAAFPLENPTEETCPATRAIDSGRTQAIQQIGEPETFDRAAWHDAALAEGIESAAAIPVAYEGQTYGAIIVSAPSAALFSDRELDVLDELGDTVGYAVAAVQRREREQILTSLYETTQDLVTADSQEEITSVVVNAADGVLDAPGVGIFLFDDEDNVLRPAAATDELLEYYDGTLVFGPGRADSATWQAYATGETSFFADIRESDHVANPQTEARSTLLIPLGNHGVFVVSSPERGVFGEQKRRLIGLLAATTEAALDRVVGQAGIRERDRALEERTERVEQLERILGLTRETIRLLPRASTRSEVVAGVCEHLVTLAPYSFAWIGHTPPDGDALDPEAWAGAEDGYLDAASLALDGDEPAVEVARSGESVIVPDVTDSLQQTDWARHAVDRDIQSVLAVPLTHGKTIYGVLAVYAPEPDTFGEFERAILEQIGETIAYGISTIETNRGILSDQLTELEIEIAEPDTFLNAVAEIAGEPVTYREITPETGNSTRVLFTLPDPPVEEVLALESEFVAVESLTNVERGDGELFRATLSGANLPGTLLSCGAIPQEIVAEAAGTRAVVRLPQELDVRVFLDRLGEHYPTVELVSRQTVDRGETPRRDLLATFEEELTDRQREVLLTAFESGFFESPRETTGEELADLLDLSQPTVTHHLREGQRRIFAALLTDDTTDV
jgi:PAS domain S-box-containing protein